MHSAVHDAPVAAMIGSLSEEKQVGHAIEAIARLPDLVLLVAGDGPLRAELEVHAERVAPGRVRFLGNVDDVRTVLHACDVLVMTSRTEGMPGAVIEAGLCGIPTVAPAIGAMESLVIHDKTGMITESTSPEVVARMIETAPADRRFRWSGSPRPSRSPVLVGDGGAAVGELPGERGHRRRYAQHRLIRQPRRCSTSSSACCIPSRGCFLRSAAEFAPPLGVAGERHHGIARPSGVPSLTVNASRSPSAS
jgi:glycosyltransferase involved in cell wall biosynthesis